VDPDIDTGGGFVYDGSDLLEEVIGSEQDAKLGRLCELRGRDVSRPRNKQGDDGGEGGAACHVASS
jgi:hypothetical protein